MMVGLAAKAHFDSCEANKAVYQVYSLTSALLTDLDPETIRPNIIVVPAEM